MIDSGEDGCRRIWPRYFNLESEIRSEEGTQEGRTGYVKESKNSLEQGESVGEMTMEVRVLDLKDLSKCFVMQAVNPGNLSWRVNLRF